MLCEIDNTNNYCPWCTYQSMKVSKYCPSRQKCKKVGVAEPWAFGWSEFNTCSNLCIRLKALDSHDVSKILNGEIKEPQCGICGAIDLHNMTMEEHKKLCKCNAQTTCS